MLTEQRAHDLFALLKAGHAVAIEPGRVAAVIDEIVNERGLISAEQVIVDIANMRWRSLGVRNQVQAGRD